MTIHIDFKHNVLLGVLSTKVTSPFGQRTLSFHTGIDIKPTIAQLTKVGAYTRGLVKEVSYTTVSGNFIILTHDDNTQTEYRHLANGSIPCKVGEVVELGQVIGIMGNTGTVTGTHLHFAIKINGTYVDPLPYLQGINDIKPYKESYTMIRPDLPKLKILVDNLYYRDAPNGNRVDYLEEKSYDYLGKTAKIGGYEWGQIVLRDDIIVWCGLAPTLNQYIPLPPVIVEVVKVVEVPKPFHAELDQDGQHLIVDIKTIVK